MLMNWPPARRPTALRSAFRVQCFLRIQDPAGRGRGDGEYAILLTFALAAILTPPDVITQCMMAGLTGASRGLATDFTSL
ncbi:twin-arginine translocase subunit TatC, partial [Thermodesulfobacteriota bacterium]